MSKKVLHSLLLLALFGALIAGAVVHMPKAHASMHMIRSVVYWTGLNCMPVRSPYYPNGTRVGVTTICGGYSDVSYPAIPGEWVGADPMPNDNTTTLGCKIYVDGYLDYSDYAPDGDLHNVNCLRILNTDYSLRGVQSA
jgi:hypothetical protein